MSNNYDFDIIVIGSGPGGQKAAIHGAKAGKRVALVERARSVGGECLFHGTIPSKTLREAALNLTNLRSVSSIFDYELRSDLEIHSLMGRLDEVLELQHKSIKEQLLRNEVTLIHGKGELIDKNQIKVQHIDGATSTLSSEFIVIATGSRPRRPPEIPVDHEHILDSDSILSMIYLPESLTVLGGGVISSEYASIFALLGVKVTMIDRAPRPLMFMDPELVTSYLDHFKQNGGVHYGEADIKSVEWDGVSQVITRLASGEIIFSDKMLVALGRLANVENLGLEELSIEQSKRGHIVVDDFYRTSIPNIYAVGDVIGWPSLAASAMEQGRRAVCHALNITTGSNVEFKYLPIGIYAIPEMASVGLSEEEARETFGDIIVGKANISEIARAQISGATTGLLKLVVAPDGKKLLGVHIVCQGAADLIHAGELALFNGNDVSIFQENVLNFPTMSQAYRNAALDVYHQFLKRAPEAVLA